MHSSMFASQPSATETFGVPRGGFRTCLLIVALLLGTTYPVSGSPAPSSAARSDATPIKPERPFILFDAMNFRDKPDLTHLGFRRLNVIYAQEFWGEFEDRDQPRENAVRTIARRAAQKGGLVCIDIEHWRIQGDDTLVNQDSIAKYRRVAYWMHEAQPGLRLGFYGMPPVRNYWTPVNAEPEALKKWHRINTRLMPIAAAVDVIFPSLYTFYDNPDGWKKYARANLRQAAQYNRPVYAFLNPKFHPGGDEDLAGSYVSADYWRRQLEICYDLADGVVIWSSPNDRWRKDAPWWQATVRFIQQKNIASGPAKSPAQTPDQ